MQPAVPEINSALKVAPNNYAFGRKQNRQQAGIPQHKLYRNYKGNVLMKLKKER